MKKPLSKLFQYIYLKMATFGSQNVHSEMRDSKHLFSSRPLLPSNAMYVVPNVGGFSYIQGVSREKVIRYTWLH